MATVAASPPARILVTDDQAEILRLVERTLGELYVCEFAGSVVEARRRLHSARFDLALCDIEMPGESGLVLVEEIHREHPDTAIVLVTGVDDSEVARRAFELGAHGYLVKPFRPGQLLITAMNALLRRELELAQEAHSKAMEERLQMLMDMAPVPIYIKDRERRYLIANRVAHELAGLEPGGLIGLTDASCTSAEGERMADESDRRILAGEGTCEGEETIIAAGQERTFQTVKFPYLDDAGEIAGISGISTDVTDKKKADELRAEIAEEREHAIADLRASRQETVERLARALEMHDPDTGEHVKRMAKIAAFLGQKVGLDPESVLMLRAAAPMHDVGKIATPDAILQKPGPLTPEERQTMELHTSVGHRMLVGSKSRMLQMSADIALTHHERWDGEGYPRGLVGEAIPIEGRIVAVADVFDALLSDRCYRPGMPLEKVLEIMGEGRGSQFDPLVFDALTGNLDEVLALRGDPAVRPAGGANPIGTPVPA